MAQLAQESGGVRLTVLKGARRAWLAIAWFLCLGCEGGDRARELEGVGRLLGFGFSQELAPSLAKELRELPSIAQAKQSFLTSALVSGDTLVFDWTWRKGPLKERNREKQTMVAVQLPGRAFPAFVWAERGRLSREDLRFLDGAVDFHDVPSFSDRFDVAGRDRAGIRAVFDARRRERLTLPDGLRVEGHGQWLIGYRPGALILPGDVAARVEELRSIAEAMR